MASEHTLLATKLSRSVRGVFQTPGMAHQEILSALNNALKGRSKLVTRTQYDTILGAWNELRQSVENGKPASQYMGKFREFHDILQETLGRSLRKAA